MKAIRVKDVSEKFTGVATLYRVEPPIPYSMNWDTDEYEEKADYVVASETYAMFSGPETYPFPADEEGNVLDWGELTGSYRGGLNGDRAIENAGYTIED